MPGTALASTRQACVWMSAGVVGYRLCSRDFDCEHCLFDAAIRGPAGQQRGAPEDRLYSAGHGWLMPLPDATVWRIGLDAFATSLLGSIAGVRRAGAGRDLRTGDVACLIDPGIGELAVRAPLPCRPLRLNPALADRPDRLIAEPYDEGWLLEIAVTDLSGLLTFDSPAAARDRFHFHLARFTRTAALELIASPGTAARLALQAGRPLTDLGSLLGAARHLELLRDFIH